ncbi:hypothetical protein BLNAU_12010 [Blattamonas nauphoetae]|uniref:Uncharacterized protein n=1 Tax=Blattamonas nauphoetae TaxID=2049346 RepID=A0ABQ9XRH7_9EUKA|nr:hypothetical protein BLNAU_12010 [Blattamonas nauphoetae]
MFSHPSPGTPIETSTISNDFYENFRHLVTDVTLLKEQRQTFQMQIDLQKEQLTESKSEVERLKKEIEEARTSARQLKQEMERSTQKIEQQTQLFSQQKDQIHQQNEMIAELTKRVEIEKKTNEEARMNMKQQLQNEINSAQNLQRTATTPSTNKLVHLFDHFDGYAIVPLVLMVFVYTVFFHLSPFMKASWVGSVGQDDGVIGIVLGKWRLCPFFGMEMIGANRSEPTHYALHSDPLSSTEDAVDVCPFADDPKNRIRADPNGYTQI